MSKLFSNKYKIIWLTFVVIMPFVFSSCFFANYPERVNTSFAYNTFYKNLNPGVNDTVVFTLRLSDSSSLNEYKTIGKTKITDIQIMFNYYSGIEKPVYFGKLYYSDTASNNLILIDDEVTAGIAGSYNYYNSIVWDNDKSDNLHEILYRDKVVKFYFIGSPTHAVITSYFYVLFEIKATVYPNV